MRLPGNTFLQGTGSLATKQLRYQADANESSL
jgi:hypothetical protein